MEAGVEAGAAAADARLVDRWVWVVAGVAYWQLLMVV